MAPPPSTAVPPLVGLLVRIVTLVCLLVSIVVLVTTSYTDTTGDEVSKLKFSDFYAYRYLLSASVVGLAYSFLQTALTVLLVTTGNRIGADSMLLFDFYADKVISYVVATGAAAGFGLSVDLKRLLNAVDTSELNTFLHKAEAAASLCLLAFVLTALSSIFSSLSLPKRVQ
ncbi:OLC1v1017157C1 [Oldenlandia corymbosa var. corymbosa]|uniref:CASP-like protein n=1 Tax=Oldenlandia corymbosa var. corymbosa TaxID=529605 RepID=A0AAV1E8R9_OLDCO|nr:OLC1v1017157C1 [Oldenlandia corymbosa var. corymbosa]